MTREEWRSKINERDSTIKQMRRDGMTGTEISKRLNVPQSTVYGALGHESRGKEKDMAEIAEMENLIEGNRALNALKERIHVGDKVKMQGIDYTVCAIYPHVILAKNLKGKPCLKCVNGGKDCERLCRETFEPRRLFDICRDYWQWFENADRCTPMYMDISRIK